MPTPEVTPVAARLAEFTPSIVDHFHPFTARWFRSRFDAPTDPQRLGWPAILSGKNTLIAAPTGSGKTLAAFLVCIDQLLRTALTGQLEDRTSVLYISPLKALSNDIHRNLSVPLQEIHTLAHEHGCELPPIRVMVRTGDTPSHQRQAMVKRPPHVVVTTPESFYLLLTSEGGRRMLQTVRTVIVDEIHALARDKRGAHLALSLERLQALCAEQPLRIGLSATQKPLDEIAGFLVGGTKARVPGSTDCRVIDAGHLRTLDLEIEVPATELSAVCSLETWAEIHSRLCELIRSHRSTLIFVNTRRLAERICYALTGVLGEEAVASHHGSLSRSIRLAAEERLKSGKLKAIVATASLELGIDIGFIDLVCQIGSPRSIATFLQRVGRSGHSLGVIPKGRLFALTRDELLEAMALIRAVKRGRLDAIEIPENAKDILAQQIVAEVACQDWQEDELFALCRRAWHYRNMSREHFDKILGMLSEGVGRSRRGAYLHRDRIHNNLRARRGARLAALMSGGAIPDNFEYRVVTAGERTFVGTVNEDFAIESMAGDIFVLGNSSWRIVHVRGQEVVVEDANGAPASIPFWFGEAPGRTFELSAELSQLRRELAERAKASERTGSTSGSSDGALHAQPVNDLSLMEWLRQECGAGPRAAEQAVQYVRAQQAAIGLIPTQTEIVFERFFDQSGGMQLVVHAPLGSRINRAWGLAMRKRFCRQFDFELQASADDNGFVLSLGTQHSFPIEVLFKFLQRGNAEHILSQALLAVPMFQVRWRWNITRALAVLRHQGGKRVPPQLQRFRSDDLLTAVFPAQTACLENRPEDIDIPDHLLVQQTVYDCLHEAMDFDRWLQLIGDIQDGKVTLLARDTREPSPFSYELLNANPYAFLDNAPLEERRARAVFTRLSLAIDEMSDLTQLDPEAITQVQSEAWPLVRDAEELHDALLIMKALPEPEGESWREYFEELSANQRAATVIVDDQRRLWIAAESWPLVRAALPNCKAAPLLALPASIDTEWEAAAAWVEMVRGRLSSVGPTTAAKVAAELGMQLSEAEAALAALEGEGFAMRGRFTPAAREAHSVEWCDRRLLARIHRLTLENLRRQIQPVSTADFMQFLLEHQHLAGDNQLLGQTGLLRAIEQLQGFEAPAPAWEPEILARRLVKYETAWLDNLSLSGEVSWGRLQPPRKNGDETPSRSNLTRAVPVALLLRSELAWLLPEDRAVPVEQLRSNARLVLETLQQQGALFFADLQTQTKLLPSQLEEALGELAALGLVSADGFAALRGIVAPKRRHTFPTRPRWRQRTRMTNSPHSRGGRWSLFPGSMLTAESENERIENWAWQLLDRYGVAFREVLVRESAAPPWRELVMAYRRLELRGEIRGGRFVSGVAGEQFARAETIEHLRQARDRERNGKWQVISACDPANLFGIVTVGERIPALRTNRLAVRNGALIASLQKREITFHQDVNAALADEIKLALKRSPH